MTLPRRLGAALARVEPRHWAGLGASVLLHLLVALGWRPSPPPEPRIISFEIDLQPPVADSPPPERMAAAPQAVRKPAAKAKPKAKARDRAREAHTLDAEWRGETGPVARLPEVVLPDAQALGVAAAAMPRAVYERAGGDGAPATASEAPLIAVATKRAAPSAANLAAQAATAREAATLPSQAPAADARITAAPDTMGRAQPGLAAEPAGNALAARAGIPTTELSASADAATTSTPQGIASGAQLASAETTLAQADGSAPMRQASLTAAAQAETRLEPAAAAAGARSAAGDGAARAQAGVPDTDAGPRAHAENAPASPQRAAGGATLALPSATGLMAGPADGRQTAGSGLDTAVLDAGGGARTAASPATTGARHDGRTSSALASGGRPGARVEWLGDTGAGTAVAPSPARTAGVAGAGEQAARAGAVGSGAVAAAPILARADGDATVPPGGRGDTARGATAALSAGTSMAVGRSTVSLPAGLVRAGDGGTASGLALPQARAAAAARGGGVSLALAPGEPGGSPDTAVALPALLATPNAVSGVRAATSAPARTLAGGAVDGTSRSLAGTTGAASGGAWVGDSSGGGGARVSGGSASIATGSGAAEAPVVLSAAHAPTVQVMRPDSGIERLDVLAPASFCPLPGFFPDNRPVASAPADDSLPGYGDNNPNFHYPLRAWAFNHEGRVTLRVEVLHDGRPGQILLKQSSGSGILDQDAREQIARWRFVPARRAGQAVTAWIDVPVVYRLRDAR